MHLFVYSDLFLFDSSAIVCIYAPTAREVRNKEKVGKTHTRGEKKDSCCVWENA